MSEKAKRLSDPMAHELSIIFTEHKGGNWAPANPEAILLSLKAKPVEDEPKSFLERLKAMVVGGYKPANLDYEAAVVCQTFYDLQKAMSLEDEGERGTAVEEVLTKYRAGSEDAEKAGKRHSAADQARIDAATAAHGKLGKAIATAAKLHDAIGAEINGLQPRDNQENGDDGTGAADEQSKTDDDASKGTTVNTYQQFVGTDAAFNEYAEACAEIGTPVEKAEGKYGDVAYADEKNKKYPIDTEEHIRAAWSYINMPKNADKYDADELAGIKNKIRAAMKRIGADVADKALEADSTQEVEMTKEEIAAMIADAVKAGKDEAKAEAQAEVDAANAATEKAVADTAAAKAEAEKATADKATSDKAAADAEAALNAEARKPTTKSGGSDEAKPRSGSLERAIKAANSGRVATVVDSAE